MRKVEKFYACGSFWVYSRIRLPAVCAIGQAIVHFTAIYRRPQPPV